MVYAIWKATNNWCNSCYKEIVHDHVIMDLTQSTIESVLCKYLAFKLNEHIDL